MRRITVTLLVFLTGAATGAFVGILYAPEKGESTRDRLNYQLSKYRDRLRELIDELMAERHEPVNTAKSEGQRVINDAKLKAERLLGDVEELIGQIKGNKVQ
jgi:gas vesicle protein